MLKLNFRGFHNWKLKESVSEVKVKSWDGQVGQFSKFGSLDVEWPRKKNT